MKSAIIFRKANGRSSEIRGIRLPFPFFLAQAAQAQAESQRGSYCVIAVTAKI